jgi:protein-tyrosine phosphatase
VTVAEGRRRFVEKVLSGVDRVTHTWSRARAAARARRREPPGRVVFVCYGNICRSPYAAAWLRHTLAMSGVADVEVDSAGFIGPGRPADRQAAAIARERGLDLGAHRSKLVGAADVGRAALCLVMTRAQRDQLLGEFGVQGDCVELLGDFDVEDPPRREIPDPYGKPDEEFRRVFGQIERSVTGLCATWLLRDVPRARGGS